MCQGRREVRPPRSGKKGARMVTRVWEKGGAVTSVEEERGAVTSVLEERPLGSPRSGKKGCGRRVRLLGSGKHGRPGPGKKGSGRGHLG
uniref:Uncharacterized protein n=1 Tax=Arundo donax TaxID=35708 RepID=A0A0A9CMT1_ARUDO